MRTMKWWGVALLACWSLSTQAGEMQVRDAVQAEVAAAFARGDYKAIEARYATALASSERTPSGLFVANLLFRGAVPEPKENADVPGRDDYWLPIEQKLEQWAARFPQSVLVASIQSDVFISHAWSWRGAGYARTVSPEGFKKVALYSQRAHDALMAREKAGRKDPYWYVQMLAVARIQGWPTDKYMALVQAATTAFPLNHDIYFAAAVKMQPRWGGSTQAIASLADFAVKQTRATEGEAMYARIYWSAEHALDTELSGPDVDWKRIRAGFEEVVKRYPDSWNLNNYARMACAARDHATARQVLLRIKDDVEPVAWGQRQAYLRCLNAAGLNPQSAR
jgi:hypothetical protein